MIDAKKAREKYLIKSKEKEERMFGEAEREKEKIINFLSSLIERVSESGKDEIWTSWGNLMVSVYKGPAHVPDCAMKENALEMVFSELRRNGYHVTNPESIRLSSFRITWSKNP